MRVVIYSEWGGRTVLFGHASVSKAEGAQPIDLQRDALLDAGVSRERVYEDRASGRHDHRPGLEACLKDLQSGNTFVWKFDRLGGNLKNLVTRVRELQGRNIGLHVPAGAGAEIDITAANNIPFSGIFAALAELEREFIAGRTDAGLAAAPARGQVGGRPRMMDVATLRHVMHAMADRNTIVHDLP